MDLCRTPAPGARVAVKLAPGAATFAALTAVAANLAVSATTTATAITITALATASPEGTGGGFEAVVLTPLTAVAADARVSAFTAAAGVATITAATAISAASTAAGLGLGRLGTNRRGSFGSCEDQGC